MNVRNPALDLAQALASRVEASRGVLVVGLGGLGCPAAATLARSGVTRFTLLDDDSVDVTNLQRQTLYSDADVGRLKAAVAAERLRALSPFPERVRCEQVVDRLLPDNALELARGHALVIEGSDNFATKFLAADAAKLAGVAIAQAGAVRFAGWSSCNTAERGACVRC
ncbi:MAG TPA: ThiF family adenylyltransferase, partial [Polyangiales bacterium]